MASYNYLFSLTIIFLFIYSTPTGGSKVALLKGRIALSHQIKKVSDVQHHLENLTKTHTNDKSLIACTKVVNEGTRLLGSVQRRMKGMTRYDSDTSLSLQTMFSAALTYLRTCSQTLKEARRHKKQQFSSLLQHVDDIGNNCFLESYTLRGITRNTMPKKKPKQGTIDLSARN
jgi:Plant invertase/pectin methylesterase inhibitor